MASFSCEAQHNDLDELASDQGLCRTVQSEIRQRQALLLTNDVFEKENGDMKRVGGWARM